MSTVRDTTDAGTPGRSTGWVARRLGLSPSTLRTWHRRYGVGPTGRTVGGHGRYRPQDVDRLERMRYLIDDGVPTGEAARFSSNPFPVPPVAGGASGRGSRPPAGRRGGAAALARAVALLDQPAVERRLRDALVRSGVVATWDGLVVPVLTGVGERYALHGDGIDAEHLFSGCLRTALAGVARPRDAGPPVLLACPDREQHSFGPEALAAALAETGCPARVLGASVPAAAVVTAVLRIRPRAVFLWSQTASTARVGDLPDPGNGIPLVVGGPGWRDRDLPPGVVRVASLGAAVRAVSGLPPESASEVIREEPARVLS